MISPRDPETMTERERRDEVASILATGLLRRVRSAKTIPSDAGKTSSSLPQFGLDLSSKTRLSVAQRPTG